MQWLLWNVDWVNQCGDNGAVQSGQYAANRICLGDDQFMRGKAVRSFNKKLYLVSSGWSGLGGGVMFL